MLKVKYQFDSKSLTFKKVKLVRKQIIIRFLLFLLVTGTSALVLNLIYSSYFQTPKVAMLAEEQNTILSKYDILNAQIAEFNQIIADIEHRDDYVYRTIFELEPIPTTVREAGFGGVNRYAEFESYDNAEILINTYKKLDVLSKKLYVQTKSFDKVIEYARNKEKMLAAIPAIQPIALKDFNRISDYFGSRNDPFTGKRTMHHGMDFTGPEGADIFATGDGVVVEAGYSFYGYGNRVTIDHGYGYETIYAHLKDIKVKEGAQVTRGDVIGTLGNTGRSTGAHLHYEVRLNNQPVDPINYYFNDLTPEQYDLMIATYSKRRTPMD
ncbi:MAG: M23 family metallopeptidase [Bacteroidales bacterium]|jgi:murein DD-endopeptidase MepM/ murein hydrolase activator NlpD|nr:M23 family metallopeptidase [Bacteroidales bacterium]